MVVVAFGVARTCRWLCKQMGTVPQRQVVGFGLGLDARVGSKRVGCKTSGGEGDSKQKFGRLRAMTISGLMFRGGGDAVRF